MTSDAKQDHAAQRMRRSRERRRKGLRIVLFEVRDTEVAELMRRGLLAPNDRDRPDAIGRALGLLLDAILMGDQ